MTGTPRAESGLSLCTLVPDAGPNHAKASWLETVGPTLRGAARKTTVSSCTPPQGTHRRLSTQFTLLYPGVCAVTHLVQLDQRSWEQNGVKMGSSPKPHREHRLLSAP